MEEKGVLALAEVEDEERLLCGEEDHPKKQGERVQGTMESEE